MATTPTNNQSSSSSSTTPPSETTLADDNVDFETSELEKYLQPARQTNVPKPGVQIDQQQQSSPSSSMQYQQQKQAQNYPLAIHTDYESSAAEDSELFTLGKYETAEFALLSYSRTNKLDKLQGLLEAKARGEISLNLNFKGQQKQNFSWSALHLACYFGHIHIVELLLSKKDYRDEIDINIKNNSGDTPLHKATLTNRVQIVQFLLSNGANVFIKNCDGLLAKQLTSNKHIFDMLEAAEQADKILFKQNMFKAVDNGDLKKLQDYFHHYNMLADSPSMEASVESETQQSGNDQAASSVSNREPENEASIPDLPAPQCDNVPSADDVRQMTDERGNTLLHLASMRGFKAICIYLLEQGFDPYRKNDLGQSCIDISSYQLRQLFMSVKPANNQLKRLTKERVTRFEGPLMRRVRILGWKQIYVVLENGVILLFNNRKDSMNKSRRGYKYLESATCEPDPNSMGLFTVCFSDRSRATFLVSPGHINQYASFRSMSAGQDTSAKTCNQIDVIRQKWVDSIRDHIVYSTEFIRRGLKFNDDDDSEGRSDADNLNNLSNLNHLLPLDTIKSFFQEARAHYSILERHSESLCTLVQSLNASSAAQTTNSLEACQRSPPVEPDASQRNVSSSTSSTGARLFGFIRASRQASNLTNNEDERTQQTFATNSTRLRNISLTNEFLQDSWPCVLFHLRLLMESTENTKNNLGQALALMEHQEQLRQNRIQEQDERCRVLEDSLHALARDHHELEKSLSMSQIYQSPNGCRSISMSTDLNEYFDAFEDFDDEKTMTPDSSLGDDEFDRKIQELIGEEDEEAGPIAGSSKHVQSKRQDRLGYTVGEQRENSDGEDEEEEEDDMRSNCSALTAETITDQYLSAADTSQLGAIEPQRGAVAASTSR